MGTMGCVPAYDSYFIAGIKKYKIPPGSFNIKSILALEEFYNKYNDLFESIRKARKIGEIEYPQIKSVDMCFWQIGYVFNKKMK